MWDSELVQLVQAKLATAATPGFDRTLAARLAKAIANSAHTNAADRNYRSPWVVEAAELGHLSLFARMFPRGGKMDDITVVVALAHEP